MTTYPVIAEEEGGEEQTHHRELQILRVLQTTHQRKEREIEQR